MGATDYTLGLLLTARRLLMRRGVADTEGPKAEKQQASGHASERMLDVYDHEIPTVLLKYARPNPDWTDPMLPGGRDPRERQAQAIKNAFAKRDERIQALATQLHQMRRFTVTHQPTSSGADELRAHETHYANTILLLAYGGFFALWVSTAGNMPKAWFGLSGILMGVSVLFFVGFELAKTIGNSLAIRKGLESDEHGQRLMSDHKVIALANRNTDRINRYWLFAFLPSVATGLAAGFIVLWFFGVHALRGEWQYPATPQDKVASAITPTMVPAQKDVAAKPAIQAPK